MFTNCIKTLCALAFGAAMSATAEIAPPEPNPNKEVMMCALDVLDIQYTDEEGKLVFLADGYIVIIDSDTERQNFTITAFNRLGIPADQRAAAYAIVNQLNVDYNMQFCIDEDGDLKVQVTFDTDNMTISSKVAASSLRRVFSGLRIGGDALSALVPQEIANNADTGASANTDSEAKKD